MPKRRFQFTLRGLFIGLTVGVIVAYPIGWQIALYTVDPLVSVNARQTGEGQFELGMRPNFVVDTYNARVSRRDDRGTLFFGGELSGPQWIPLPGPAQSGDVIDIECEVS